MIIHLKKVFKGPNLSIIKFSAIWCRPCKTVSPVYQSLSEEFKDIKFYEIDVDESEDLSSYSIKSLPTFICFKDGQEIKRMTGSDPKKLREFVSSLSN